MKVPFLLGRDDSKPARVTSYVCYDDVDPAAYQKGAIAFHASGLRCALAALPGKVNCSKTPIDVALT